MPVDMQAATPPMECVRIVEDRARLDCFDRWAAGPRAPAAAGGPSPGAAAAEPSSGTTGTTGFPTTETVTTESVAATAPAPAREPDRWATFWELDPDRPRRPFSFRTYRPNYLLPAFISDRMNDSPESPTRGTGSSVPDVRNHEVKLQLSIRTKLARSLMVDHDGLWFGYTQQSMWQLWNRGASAPFRSTDYEPEIIYVAPVPRALRALPGGWRFPMVQVGLAHQSNGQGNPLSRSWNRVYAGVGLEKGNLSLLVRAHRRLREGTDDDNPDLQRYVGRGDVTMIWTRGVSTASLLWRTDFRRADRGSIQLDWTHPLDRDRPQGLRWYLQFFSGYGQTLLDYNFRQTSVGAGLTLFEF